MITKPFPGNIPVCLNRASPFDRQRLDLTCDHFKINGQRQRQLMCEVILRLGHYINNSTACPLPVDERGKMLYRMYKYYDSLHYMNN